MSEMRQFFEETAERLFADSADQETIEAAEAGAFPAALWSALAENGFPVMRASEAAGGVGASVGDAAAVMRVAGRHAAPGPLLETIVANRLLADAGLAPSEGPLALVLAVDGALRREGDWAVPTRSLGIAQWAREAGEILIVGRSGGESILAKAAPEALELIDVRGTVTEPRCRVGPGRPAGIVATLSPEIADEALLEASTLNAARIVGALEWCLVAAVDYTMQRKQFGRELAKFQAVQQMLAQVASETVGARAIADAAAEAGLGSSVLISAARGRIGDAVDLVCALVHQVHGAIGFSREYALNYRTRRLMQWRDEFGTTGDWRLRLSRPFAGLKVEELWPAVVEGGAL